MYGRYDACALSPGLTNTRIASANNPSLHVARFRPPKITDLKEGILDPFPLLRGQESAPSTGKGRAKQVNPLLLVTERRGTASSLHYGAFPLDAFNTDGASSLFFSGSQRLSVEATFLCPQSKSRTGRCVATKARCGSGRLGARPVSIVGYCLSLLFFAVF